MTLRTVIWSHGQDAAPWGDKSRALHAEAESLGLTMRAIDYRHVPDPDQRVDLLIAEMAQLESPPVLIGSSMGGYVSAAAALRRPVAGLILLAPAFFFPGYAVQDFSTLTCPVHLVHGWSDEVVDFQRSLDFARPLGANVHMVKDGHRLSQSIPFIRNVFRFFMKSI